MEIKYNNFILMSLNVLKKIIYVIGNGMFQVSVVEYFENNVMSIK